MSAFAPKDYPEALAVVQKRQKAAQERRTEKGAVPQRSSLKRSQSLSSKQPIARKGRVATKKKVKRAKMPSRKSLIKKADALVSRFVRARDKVCVECGKTADQVQLTCGHVFGRRSHGARFDITPDGNCHCQCAPCNFKAAATAAVSYHAWYVRTFGAEAFQSLYERWSAGRQWKRPDLVELCEELTLKVAEMENLT